MSTTFVTGQRWISNAEPELGLGIILQAESRRVVIAFPAAEDERQEHRAGERRTKHDGPGQAPQREQGEHGGG